MDYPGAKFSDFSFSHFFIVWTDRQNHRHTHTDDRLTHMSVISVSNETKLQYVAQTQF